MQKLATVLLFCSLIFGSACQSTDEINDDGRIKILTTTGIIADAAKIIAGDLADVHALMGPGVDPHLFKASAGDIARISNADIILYNGLYLEGKMADILKKLSNRGTTAIAVGEAISPELLHASSDHVGHPDPHVWFDAALWQLVTKEIIATLVEYDPANAATYQENGNSYLEQLVELDDYCLAQYATIPEQQRILITAHDAFGYLGAAYNIKVVGLQGINTSSEYGLLDVQNLVDMIIDNGIKAVFVESSVPRKAIEAVVQGCQASGHNVIIGGELFSDAMGEEGTPEGNYLGMVRHNVDSIVSALK
jgi:manganese/zinc/iron transport system substrate-binding protein